MPNIQFHCTTVSFIKITQKSILPYNTLFLWCVFNWNQGSTFRDHSHITSTPKPMKTLPPSPHVNNHQHLSKFFTHLPPLPSITVNIFVFFNPPSPYIFYSKTLTILLLTLPPLLPSTTVNIFTFVDPPSPPTVNNRQQILNSKPSHPPPLKSWRNMWMTPVLTETMIQNLLWL